MVARLADRTSNRSEATIQADIRQLLLTAPFDLRDPDLQDVPLETAVGRRRIDIETGSTVIEVKRDLRSPSVREDAIAQLADYVATRQDETGRRFVGLLADGVEWICYHLVDHGLEQVSAYSLDRRNQDTEGLLLWLEGVMATARNIPPAPLEIQRRLGAGTSSHALDRATLGALFAASKTNESVQLKRGLWARLLRTALGTQFDDEDDLFVEHTLLVNSAEIIAHAVLGLRLEVIEPSALLSGSTFHKSGIYGVVESDFFDWVIEVPGGEAFIRSLARRLGRFEWSNVEHDVLKVLYESVIPKETRKKLGEYYTPDWLAEAMIARVIDQPLTTRVLDPSCGSGTFLFHAVRRFVRAAEASGMSQTDIFEQVTSQVLGLDLHPVAVTLARVTYLLAIGRERLVAPGRPVVRIPVYLGDSIQWRQKGDSLFTHGNLVIETIDGVELLTSELKFPDKMLEDPALFDGLVEDLAAKASQRRRGAPPPKLTGVFQRFDVPEDWRDTLSASFSTLCRLHDQGRDHIWSYYVRNLARPRWLEREENRVDMLIGNPPWLAYRHMTGEMQETFRAMSQSRSLWHGARVATHQDLSALFVARSIQKFLRGNGQFAFVMPNGVLDRKQYAGFRSGLYPDTKETVSVAFEEPWNLKRIRPHFFPVGAAVIFGRRLADPLAVAPRSGRRATAGVGTALPTPLRSNGQTWSGTLPADTNISWAKAATHLKWKSTGAAIAVSETGSPYRSRFTQGASLVPRVLLSVEDASAGPLGVPDDLRSIQSARSANEKEPWKNLRSLRGAVERDFVPPLYLGETVLPYRLLPPSLAVVPWDGVELCHGEADRLELYPGLCSWWRQAEELWMANRSETTRISLIQQVNFMQKLTKQFPISPLRVVYTKSGMHLAAAIIEDLRGVIDHKLYWMAASTREEATYICAILNSATVTQRVRPLMSYGKDERDIDKYVWELPIPEYDPSDDAHCRLSGLGSAAEAEVQALKFTGNAFYTSVRRKVRAHLAASATGRAIEELVAQLLD